MNLQLVEKIANAVLYEGYLLYPYRPSAVKNQRRFNFGVLMPRSYSEAQIPGTESWQLQTECLALGNQDATLEVKVRFLHLRDRKADGTSWQEAVEREVNATGLKLGALIEQPHRFPFFFPAAQQEEVLRDAQGKTTDVIVWQQEAVEGIVKLQVVNCGSGRDSQRLFRVTVKVLNLTEVENAGAKTRDEALMHSLASAHLVLGVNGGEFISLLDPPEEFREAAASCQNIGVWPVLAGEEGERDLMLSSPIILYDYPLIALESAGDLFDGAEIDEILTLRILTLTDEEKHEMRHGDERARQILERTETLPPEQLMKLHGALRRLRPLEADPVPENHERIGMAVTGR